MTKKPNPILNRARPEIIEMKAYSSARSLYKAEEGMIFLDANEFPYDAYIGADHISRYPDQQPEALTQALCRLYDVSSRNMTVTRGADEAIDVLLRSFCIPSKDNIIIAPPTFVMYAQAATLQSTQVKKVPLKKDFSLDVGGIIKAADENTKLVFVCTPNNPTGNTMDQSSIAELCAYFKDKALVIIDEAYIEFSDQDSFIPWIEKYPNIVVLRTLSKAYAAAGIRCGVAIAQQEVSEILGKVLAPYPIPKPVVTEALKILSDKNIKRLQAKHQTLLETKQKFIKALSSIPDVVEVFPSDANFVLVKTKNAQAFVEKSVAAKIILRNQTHVAGLENCVRIAIGTNEEMDLLIDALSGKIVAIKQDMRRAQILRNTKETAISVDINLDATAPVSIHTGIGFYDHMLEQIAKHGGFSLKLECAGDLEIDPHHTIEDCAIALGEALKKALGDKYGIGRYGFTVPMDEALASAAIDLSGRFFLVFDAQFPAEKVGDLPTDMVEHIFRSLAENLQATVHISVKGDNTHHMVEGCFKAFGRALRQAISKGGNGDELPSTKGVL